MEKQSVHAFASRLTGTRVDFEKRVIYGVVVMTVGNAFGHTSVDARTLQQFMAATGDGKEKIRGREDHPDKDLMGKSTGIAKKVNDLRGFFFNLRVDDNKLVADFQALSEDAAGKEPTRLLHKAAEAPEIFGVSPVFFGKPENGVSRVSKVVAIDFVDIPAGDNANQHLFEGVLQMAEPIKCEEREGKFYAKFEADMPKGEYEIAFPPKADDKKEMDADGAKKDDVADAKKKEEMAAVTSDTDATKKDLTAAPKTFSATDVANAEREGKKKAHQFAADFDGVMDAAGLKGQARDDFRKSYFAKGETFGLEYVKDLAKVAMSARTVAVGEGSGGGAKEEANGEFAQRFAAKSSVRAMYGCHTDDKDSAEYKAALKDYVETMSVK